MFEGWLSFLIMFGCLKMTVKLIRKKSFVIMRAWNENERSPSKPPAGIVHCLTWRNSTTSKMAEKEVKRLFGKDLPPT